jgi:hypothetical protein
MTTAGVTTHLITDMLKHEHANVTYLKQEGISLAISKALTQTYLEKPKNPIDFFAKSLLSQVKTKRAKQEVRKRSTFMFVIANRERAQSRGIARGKQIVYTGYTS